jgi:phage baseplate assembly protein gpV
VQSVSESARWSVSSSFQLQEKSTEEVSADSIGVAVKLQVDKELTFGGYVAMCGGVVIAPIIVTWRLTAGIMEQEGAAVTKQRGGKHVSATTN